MFARKFPFAVVGSRYFEQFYPFRLSTEKLPNEEELTILDFVKDLAEVQELCQKENYQKYSNIRVVNTNWEVVQGPEFDKNLLKRNY